MPRGPGTIQKKILLLLLGGAVLGISGNRGNYRKIKRIIAEEWKEIDRRGLYRSIRALYESKLVGGRNNPDGSITLVLSKEGRRQALTYKLDEMSLKRPATWDGKWHIIAFDIPESRKKARDALRFQLLRMGFQEFQKSIFIYPYPCDEEIDFVIEFFHVTRYVRRILADDIDTALHWKKKFKLL